MNGSEIVLILFVVRLVIPVALMLWIGETARRRNLTPAARM